MRLSLNILIEGVPTRVKTRYATSRSRSDDWRFLSIEYY
jgi:hypothetical protein